jgi:hypothetical protein
MSNMAVYPILGLGLEWQFLNNTALGGLTLTEANLALRGDWRLDPYFRPFTVAEYFDQDMDYGQRWSLTAFADAWFAPAGKENLEFGLGQGLRWLNREEIKPDEEFIDSRIIDGEETPAQIRYFANKYLDSVLLSTSSLGMRYSRNKFFIGATGSLLWQRNLTEETNAWGWGADVSIGYGPFSLFSGITAVNNEYSGYLRAQWDLSRNFSMILGGDVYYREGTETTRMNGNTTTTTITQDSIGFGIFGGIRLRF